MAFFNLIKFNINKINKNNFKYLKIKIFQKQK